MWSTRSPGRYFIESLTNEIEQKILELMREVEEKGGVMKAIANGSIQRDLGRQAYDWEIAIERKEVMKVGVNCFQVDEEEGNPEVYEHAEDAGERQLVRLRETKAKRDQTAVTRTLNDLRRAAEAKENLMPSLLQAVKAYATIGEISGVLKSIYGEFNDPVQM